jgi:hypothetical protein
VVRDVGIAVDVVPAGIDQHPVVGDAGIPLVRLVKAQADDVTAIGPHGKQGVHGAVSPATQVPAATFGDEGDPAVGQEAGVEVVLGPVGQLDQTLPSALTRKI